MKINEAVKPIVDFLKNILGVALLALISIVYVKDALELNHPGRIGNGIFWLVIGLVFYLLACIKPLMKWMYGMQTDWIKRKQTFEEFQKDGKKVFYGAIYFALINFILAFFY